MTNLGHPVTRTPEALPPLLMTPGPTRVPERVLRAGARPMMHHRSVEFSNELADMLERIGPVFGTRSLVLPVHTTGRGAMEATICNLFSAGDEIVVCGNGKFGMLWANLAAACGLTVQCVSTDWGRNVDPVDVDRALSEHPQARAVALTYSDTSTGGSNDVAAIGRIAAARGVLVLVDGVSAVGGMPFAFDEWGVDVAVTASQKCLMSSPGLSFAAVSERAWAATSRARLPHNYWNFAETREYIGRPRPEPPGTPPIHVVMQVTEALRMIHEEGLDEVYRRHERMASHVRQRATELGLTLQCPELRRFSNTVTAIAVPEAGSLKLLRDRMQERGILVAGGMGQYESTAFRIGHMGDIRPADVERTLAALADVIESTGVIAGRR